jgi:hypothetical protein
LRGCQRLGEWRGFVRACWEGGGWGGREGVAAGRPALFGTSFHRPGGWWSPVVPPGYRVGVAVTPLLGVRWLDASLPEVNLRALGYCAVGGRWKGGRCTAVFPAGRFKTSVDLRGLVTLRLECHRSVVRVARAVGRKGGVWASRQRAVLLVSGVVYLRWGMSRCRVSLRRDLRVCEEW